MNRSLRILGLVLAFCLGACSNFTFGDNEHDDDDGGVVPDANTVDGGGFCLHDNWCPDGQHCVDGTCVAPDGGVGDPDASTTSPDAGTGDTDAATSGPDGGGTVGSDGGVSEPDADTGGGQDGGSTGNPDGGTASPDGGVSDPPDGGTVDPECLSNDECADGEVCTSGECVCDGGGGGDDQAPCGDGRTRICHVPPGNPANQHSFCVGDGALTAHTDHGDTLGACP